MTDSIQAAIAAAQQAASNLTQNLPTIETVPTAPGQYAPAPTTPATLDGFLDSGSFKVDNWLRTEASGFYVKGHDLAVDQDKMPALGITVGTDLQPFYGLRLMIGGSPRYYKTVQRDICVKTGEPWAKLISDAAAQGQREYRGFDVRFTVLEPIVDLKGNPIASAPVGSSLGYSTSITNFSDVAEFARKVREAGLMTTPLAVKIKCEKRTNDKNPKGWGALVFGEFNAVQ